jgi:hypothetical protein
MSEKITELYVSIVDNIKLSIDESEIISMLESTNPEDIKELVEYDYLLSDKHTITYKVPLSQLLMEALDKNYFKVCNELLDKGFCKLNKYGVKEYIEQTIKKNNWGANEYFENKKSPNILTVSQLNDNWIKWYNSQKLLIKLGFSYAEKSLLLVLDSKKEFYECVVYMVSDTSVGEKAKEFYKFQLEIVGEFVEEE